MRVFPLLFIVFGLSPLAHANQVLDLLKTVEIGSGYMSKMLCSGLFVQHRDRDDVVAEILERDPALQYISHRVGDAGVSSHAFLLYPKVAGFNEQTGCSLHPDVNWWDVWRWQRSPRQRSWQEVSQDFVRSQSLVNLQKLDEIIDEHFVESNPNSLKNTSAVIVVHKGEIIAERYARGFHKDMPHLSWSLSKSALSTLVGIMVKRGMIDINEPMPVAEWGGDERSEITWNHMLTMTSGLKFIEDYGDPDSDIREMLYNSVDMGAYAANQPLLHRPGEHYHYASGTSNVISRAMRKVFADDEAYHQFPYEALLDPMGWANAVFESDASGTFVGASYLYATARDWASLGQLYLQNGYWQGQQLLPSWWVEYATTPSAAAPKGKYGAHWSTNYGNDEGRRWPSLPSDLYAATGHDEQYVMVVPSKELVVVRLGYTLDEAAFSIEELTGAILATIPD